MKTFVYYFSSTNEITTGNVLNGYYFVNPATGSPSFSYPLTADGGINTTDFDYTSSYPVTATDGLFFPWGYNVQNTFINDTLPPLKGDYVIVYCLSATNIQPLKIFYDFGDGQSFIITKPLFNTSIFSNLNNYIYGPNANPLSFELISHNYYALSTVNTFMPSITIINSNLTRTVFNLTVTLYPNSLYDIADNLHLLGSTQLITTTGSNFNILEVGDDSMTTNLETEQVSTTLYPLPYTPPNTSQNTSTSSVFIPEESLVFVIE